MFTTTQVNFSKNEDCPHSADLLSYGNGDLERERACEIRSHLSGCEFCAAEVEFYSHYPQLHDDEPAEPEAIPQPLYELADALLNHRSNTASFEVLFKR